MFEQRLKVQRYQSFIFNDEYSGQIGGHDSSPTPQLPPG